MAGEPFAGPDDYELLTAGTLSAAQRAQVGALLAEASDLMRAGSAGLDDRLDAGTVSETVVIGLAVRVVQRYLANPTQASQVTTGPFSRAYAVANARGLYVTSDELAGIAPPPADDTRPRGVGTMRVGLPVGVARCPRGRR